MERRDYKHVEEKSYTEVTIKTEVEEAVQSTPYIDIETNGKYTEEKPGLVELVKSEPALLVKEEVVEDSIAEQQCVQGPSTSFIVGSMNVFDSIGDVGNVLNIKEELGAKDTGPTVLQHMDTQGTTDQKDMSIVKQERTINHEKIDPMLCGGVKEEIIEDEWRGSIAPQETLLEPNSQRSVDWQVKSPQTSNGSKRGARGSKPRNYICDYCKKMFIYKKGIQQHIANVHSSRSYKCDECNKIFKCKGYLTNHISRVHTAKVHTPKVHTPKVHTAGAHSQLYRCGDCLKTYNSKKALAVHRMQVHGKKSYKCTKCDKEYKCRAYLSNHVLYVHNKQSYECAVCMKVYKSKSALIKHVKSLHPHKSLGLRAQAYTCDYCQETFSTKFTLQRHTKSIHVAAHIHRCRTCSKKFESNDELQQHKTSYHGPGQHKCKVCLRRYMYKYTLSRHFKKAHNSKHIQFKSDVRQHEMPDSRPSTDDMNAAATTSTHQHNVDIVKEEPADGELELGPIVFQHMDCNYRPHKEEPQDVLWGLK